MAEAADVQARALAIAARGGDQEAFADLVRLYVDRLFRFLVARGISRDDAQDLVQETFLRAWQAIGRYDDRYAVSTWLYTIAQRLALNLRARQGRRAHVRLADDVAVAVASDQSDEAPGGLWLIARSSLSQRDYEALWLYYAEEQDMRGVAGILGVSALHARVIVHRARARLAKLIDADGAAAGVTAGETP